MEEFTEHTTVEDAIDALARGTVKSAKGEGQEVAYMPIKDLIEADRYRAAKEMLTELGYDGPVHLFNVLHCSY